MPGANPGWTTGYIPPATEWNTWWSNKLDFSTVSPAMLTVIEATTLALGLQALFADNETNGLATYQEVFPGVTAQDSVVGYTTITAGSTLVQKTAIAGYARALTGAAGGNQNAVCLFACGTAEVNNGATWGINTLLQDNSTRAVGTHTGIFLVNEFDFNVMCPNTQVIGLSVGGNSLAQPTTATGYIVNPLGTGIQWSAGFLTEDNATHIGLALGLNTSLAANVSSQQLFAAYGDTSGARQNVILQATSAGVGPGGYLTLSGTANPTHFDVANGNIVIQSGDLVVGALPVVGPRQTGWGTASNGSTAAFNGSTATLGQTSAAVAAIIQALFTHGLIGT